MGHVAVYCRASRDADDRAESVTVQETNGRRYADQHWPHLPVEAYVDNDLSAADPTVRRPAYEQLIAAVRRGDVEHVVCAEQSRLTRQPAQWEELVVILALARIDQVDCYRSAPVPIRGSRLVGRILAAVDAEEVERTRARVVEALDARARAGRPAGGRIYGYRRVTGPDGRPRLAVNPGEARWVRWAAQRVLAGWSLISVARHLTAKGVPTALGGRWHVTTVRSMLLAPTVAGQRVHRGEIIGPGEWEPILDVVTWRQVRAVLEGPVRVRRPDGGSHLASRSRRPPRRYLLSGGIALCGLCGTPLRGQRRQRPDGRGEAAYQCDPRAGGCARVNVHAAYLEAWVTDRLLAKLETPGFAAALSEDDGTRERLAGRLADLEGRRADLARRWAAGEIDRVEWDAAREVIGAETGEVAAELAGLPSGLVDPGGVRDDWPVMTLEERRYVVGSVVERVVVGPAVPGLRRFDPDRVEITWR